VSSPATAAGLAPILGHERTIAHLRDALNHGRWHHAYLFEGAEGVGKRLVALRLAMEANCTGAEPRPCGACPTCRRIAAGTHPDVILLGPSDDRASRTISVEQVREVIRTSGYHRYDARQRFVIVDPADAMQATASNALLKTLEEPPDGTGFILITTHASALLPTIRSRCQRVRFGPLDRDVLTGWLEARGIEHAAQIAQLADGRPGRALALAEGALDQRVELRQRLLTVLGGDLQGIFDFTNDLCGGARNQWMPRVDALLELVEDLLRDAVVCAVDPERPLLNGDLHPVLEAWSAALWPAGIVACQHAVEETRSDLVLNVSGKTTLDALLTRLATELGAARQAGLHAQAS
jgi:DNA polymerase-3 subunit delta'